MKKYVIYLRVSSTKQGMEGLGMEVQQQACSTYVKNKGGDVIATFVEVASGWRGRKQVELKKAVQHAKQHEAVLLCYKIDRLGRKVAEMLTILDDKNLEVEIVTMPHFNRLNFHIFSAIAEHESTMISERTKQAHKVRVANKGGWVRNPNANMVELTKLSNKAKREQWFETNKQIVAIIENCPQCTTTTLANYLNDKGIKTNGGKPFTASIIHQFRKRIERPL
jgi:DNA invertase Pin-like site-specific DNA recombinase